MSPLLWGCVVVMLFGAAMLLTDIGEPIVWIAITFVAMASFVGAAGGREPNRWP
jgi:hypothetical protein